jgi:hypothetical protein
VHDLHPRAHQLHPRGMSLIPDALFHSEQAEPTAQQELPQFSVQLASTFS